MPKGTLEMLVKPWDGSSGGNKIFWVNIAKMVGDFIKENELTPARIGLVSSGPMMAEKEFIDLGIRGGIRVNHLHYNNRIYLVDDKQWSSFSRGVIADAKAKLSQVKEVSFEQAVTLGSVMGQMGG